ncbi:hypothetical protein [Thalassoroseus pseudoceratinae]|uniref:hypothetical protein n=1 Tax=Thalassoroseus pseudoceratinae TaxID=2713176 RepID=UPI001420D877|nr:hypothetical protein [Thalassoroseus pseudoceratinae]
MSSNQQKSQLDPTQQSSLNIRVLAGWAVGLIVFLCIGFAVALNLQVLIAAKSANRPLQQPNTPTKTPSLDLPFMQELEQLVDESKPSQSQSNREPTSTPESENPQ